tara:strand:+ start:136 stop:918 length:783 start_codon:yes stop_codon:yes gene_type:complete
MAIKISGTTVIDDNRNINAGVATFSNINVPPEVLTFSPADGAVDQAYDVNIVLTFAQTMRKGTGNITIRSGSATGTVLETINVLGTGVTISAGTVTVNPTTTIPSSTNAYIVFDEGCLEGSLGTGIASITDYNFTTVALALGDAYEGGYFICCASNVYWIVAPQSAEVSRTWDQRNDANTRAQQVSSCTGWFVPNCGQLQNPGYTCRQYWDEYCRQQYWASGPGYNNNNQAYSIDLNNNYENVQNKPTQFCVRSFRCVTY